MKLRKAFTRKRVLIFLVALLLALVLPFVGRAVYLHATRGKIVIADGLRQNSRQYIENVRIENGYLYYTAINDSSKEVNISWDYPPIERKENGEWKYFRASTVERSTTEDRVSVLPFDKRERRFEADVIWEERLIAGEYRILIGGVRLETRVAVDGTVEKYVVQEENAYTLVGYFTITEEQTAVYPS